MDSLIKESDVDSFAVGMAVYYNSEKYSVVKEGKDWLIISRDNNLFCEKKNLDPIMCSSVHFREIFDSSSSITFLVKREWLTEKKVKAFFTKLSKRPCPPPMTMILKVIVDSGTDTKDIRDLLNKFESYGFGGNISRRFKWSFFLDEPDKLTLNERVALSKEMSREGRKIDERNKKRKKNGKTVTFLVGRLNELF
ncbi:MAG: hypothetical protein COU71_02550 [Parcubacteria group bacterium CG10_big_fil_rev_8_21_14_0_10_38_31]|nr:MAG: hypothetical protein COU71_02550 [Parcubacteria group bacterium CG10_big_fil_rev_8_21_14_0_10_38_31]